MGPKHGHRLHLDDQETSGCQNTAVGYYTLQANTSGSDNTVVGAGALQTPQTLSETTAIGFQALRVATGSENTAVGHNVLSQNHGAVANTAVGYEALANNDSDSRTTASAQTAIGAYALYSNIDGGFNTAIGESALNNNQNGSSNTAVGAQALNDNKNGDNNTAIGDSALNNNQSGNNNTAVGNAAGINIKLSNNIDIGDADNFGDNADTSADTGVIRIGYPGTQTEAHIAGISGVTVSGGAPVYVLSNGKLGTINSSRRFKNDVAPMGDSSSVLLALKPVTFKYKPQYDPAGIPQFGLIAEDVAKVCPALVIHDSKGQIQTVRYEQVNAMLLNEFLKDHKRVKAQDQTIAEQQKQIQALTASLARVTQQIQAVAQRIEGKDYQRVANRIGRVPNE